MAPGQVLEIITATIQPLLPRCDASGSGKCRRSKDFVSEERMAPAPDGTLIPLSIVYKKGMKLDETTHRSHWLWAYGDVFKPGFSRRNSEWIERGGILAVAHVRAAASME